MFEKKKMFLLLVYFFLNVSEKNLFLNFVRWTFYFWIFGEKEKKNFFFKIFGKTFFFFEFVEKKLFCKVLSFFQKFWEKIFSFFSLILFYLNVREKKFCCLILKKKKKFFFEFLDKTEKIKVFSKSLEKFFFLILRKNNVWRLNFFFFQKYWDKNILFF